jgi:hypothetical protein
MNNTQVLFPQRRMVAHYRAISERYFRAANAVAFTNTKLSQWALDRAIEYGELAATEERAILTDLR